MTRALVLATGLVLLPAMAMAQGSVVGSKHDLSDPARTNEPCVFCHTPHRSSTSLNVPLWNRGSATGVVFTPYQSTTLDTVVTAPSSFSLACMSCHDGVLAPLGDGVNDDKHGLLNAPGSGGSPDTTSTPNCARCHGRVGTPTKFLGTDMRNDHPVSMQYPSPAQDPDFHRPPDPQRGWGGAVPGDVKLFDGKVECSSCHEVHNPTIVPFLRKSNANDALCLTCHVK